mmetsp:Transcript_20624/g.41755  ORF Transcript_20624/g.41755 Transcript_20624/m.41755 type:complete len:95 (+) Transcript_20624:68-352(+)
MQPTFLGKWTVIILSSALTVIFSSTDSSTAPMKGRETKRASPGLHRHGFGNDLHHIYSLIPCWWIQLPVACNEGISLIEFRVCVHLQEAYEARQ